jgi:hypothetical protein
VVCILSKYLRAGEGQFAVHPAVAIRDLQYAMVTVVVAEGWASPVEATNLMRIIHGVPNILALRTPEVHPGSIGVALHR